MSHYTNEQLMDWAGELSEDLVSHPSGADLTLRAAIKKGDMEELRRLCRDYSHMLAVEHYHNTESLNHRDGEYYNGLGKL